MIEKKKFFRDTAGQFSSVTQLCPTIRDPMDCRTPAFPVHHQLPEITQTHVHQVSDAIQPSYFLSSPSLPPSIFPSIRSFQMSQFFASGGQSIGVSASASVLPNEYSGVISFRIDWLGLLAIQETQEFSPTPQFKSFNINYEQLKTYGQFALIHRKRRLRGTGQL